MTRGRVTDWSGRKVGKVTVLYRDGSTEDNHSLWMCKCDCGNTKLISSSRLSKSVKSGVLSCGCLAKEHTIKMGKASATHKLTHTRPYNIWVNMRARCNNEKHPRYKDYGGRGIFICKQWENSFESFWEWAKNNGYDDSLTLDRIDNDDGYYPENCKFSTYKEQRYNRRDSKK